jgi:hypothetical protein
VSEAGTTYFGAKVTLQLGHSARLLQQIIAKARATEEQASSASRMGSCVAGGTPCRAERALAYGHHGVAGPLSIYIFSVAAVANGLPTGLGASVAHDRS